MTAVKEKTKTISKNKKNTTAKQIKTKINTNPKLKHTSIPLGWTSVKRKRSRSAQTSSKKIQIPSDSNNNTNSSSSNSNNNNNNYNNYNDNNKQDNDENTCCINGFCWDTIHQSIFSLTKETIKGKAIFCLHDLDCKWFQGHFIPSQKTLSNLGLLATLNTQMDDCLKCADGGYKELDISIIRFPKYQTDFIHHTQTQIHSKKIFHISDLICTGGDMMRIVSKQWNATDENDQFIPAVPMPPTPPTMLPIHSKQEKKSIVTDKHLQIHFNADQIITGKKTIPYLKTYFTSIVEQIQKSVHYDIHPSADPITPILQLLPDCAIVVGTMELYLSTKNFTSSKGKSHMSIYRYLYNTDDTTNTT